MRTCCTTLLSLAVLLIICLPFSSAAGIQRIAAGDELRLELGAGLFLPLDSHMRSDHDHGYNGKISFYHLGRKRVNFGLQYRVSRKETTVPGEGGDLTTHFFGIQFGTTVYRQDAGEIQISALAYLVHARSEITLSCIPCGRPTLIGTATGPGLGAKVTYSHLVSRKITLGGDLEYNRSFLAEEDSDYGDVGGFWFTLLLGFRL